MKINYCENNLILTWSTDCAIYSETGETKFAMTDTKLYVPVVTLSSQDNPKSVSDLVLKEKKNMIK